MLGKSVAALSGSLLAAAVICVQAMDPQQQGRATSATAGTGGQAQADGDAQGGPSGRGSAYLPTESQWAVMSPNAREYVDKAKGIAGDDPDLQFDFSIFCKASGGAQGSDRATVGRTVS